MSPPGLSHLPTVFEKETPHICFGRGKMPARKNEKFLDLASWQDLDTNLIGRFSMILSIYLGKLVIFGEGKEC